MGEKGEENLRTKEMVSFIGRQLNQTVDAQRICWILFCGCRNFSLLHGDDVTFLRAWETVCDGHTYRASPSAHSTVSLFFLPSLCPTLFISSPYFVFVCLFLRTTRIKFIDHKYFRNLSIFRLSFSSQKRKQRTKIIFLFIMHLRTEKSSVTNVTNRKTFIVLLLYKLRYPTFTPQSIN